MYTIVFTPYIYGTISIFGRAINLNKPLLNIVVDVDVDNDMPSSMSSSDLDCLNLFSPESFEWNELDHEAHTGGIPTLKNTITAAECGEFNWPILY